MTSAEHPATTSSPGPRVLQPTLGDEGNSDDFSDETVMAVDTSRSSDVGCCYFSAKDKTLFLMSDVRGGSLEVLESS